MAEISSLILKFLEKPVYPAVRLAQTNHKLSQANTYYFVYFSLNS